MNIYEEFAVSHHFSEYRPDADFDDLVKELMNRGDDFYPRGFWPYSLYEDLSGNELAELIVDMTINLHKLVLEVLKKQQKLLTKTVDNPVNNVKEDK